MRGHSVLLDGSPVTELYDPESFRRYRSFVVKYAQELNDACHKLWVERIKAGARLKDKSTKK